MSGYFVNQLIIIITNYITNSDVTNFSHFNYKPHSACYVTVKAGCHELSSDLLYSRRCG